MISSKLISLASIIERVYRTVEIEVIPWADASEDVIDCLRLIGVPQSYLDKSTNGQGENPIPIIVDSFRGELPNDLVVPGPCRIIQLDNDSNIVSFKAMIETQDLFYQSPTVQEEYNTTVRDYAGSLVSTSLTMKLDEADEDIAAGSASELVDAADDLEDVVQDIRQAQGRIVTSSRRNLDFIPKYKLNGNFIYTNFKDGFVEMSYKAYPIDNDGMPMVPDNIKFIKAVEWYLISRMDYKRWRTTRALVDQKIWETSSTEASWYVGAARSTAHMPSIDQMESIKRMILRSIPKINEHSTGFKHTNVTEQRKF
jgi:hypothetical protein